METFGERLKSEREDRGLSIQAVAEILGVDHDRLHALERNDFESLPDEATMMACLHAYAECLEVDAELMIEDYVQEREKCLGRLADAMTDQAVETPPTAIPAAVVRKPRFPRVFAVVVIATVTIVGAWWIFFSGDGSAPKPEESVITAPVETQSAPSVRQAEVAPTPPKPPVEQPTPAISKPSGLSIPDCDVGTAVKNRQLVGRGDRFTEGTRVWFWTQVQGGNAGEEMDHVWLREGVEMVRISLTGGGPRWRTHSAKMLRAGSAGNWAVEARDASGQVLARREFVCVP
jgi:cytoskeletal protein RodZ